jgi:hypothetical protein
MLLAINRTLERLLYEYGNMDRREVAISFEMPTRERVERLTQPTIYLFIYSIQENLDLRHSSIESTRSNGRAVRNMAARRFDLHYMICALATDVEDEQLLLWRTLVTLVRHPQFPPELLDEDLQTLDLLPVGRMYQDDDVQKPVSLWNALGVPPHPAFYYAITVPVYMEAIDEAPLVLKRTVRYSDLQSAENISETYNQLGGVVRDKQGTALPGIKVALEGSTLEHITDSQGQFVLHRVPSGPFRLHVSSGNTISQVVSISPPVGATGKQTTNQLYTIILESGSVPEESSTN